MVAMLFANHALVSRIERAEGVLIAECAAAAKRRRPDTDLFVKHVAGGVAAYVGAGSPLNKVAGLGFGGAVDAGTMETIERELHERHAAVQVELSSLSEPSIGEMLTRRGYRLVGFENVLGLTLDANRQTTDGRPTDATIAESPADEFAAWLDTVVTGFAHPDTQGVPSHEAFPRDALERDIGDMALVTGFQRFMACRAGRPAGAASMRLHETVAQLCGAATLPADRRQGVQSALLAHRLARAAAAGCTVAVVTTQPGSKSQQNAQRKGFELLYTRAILLLEP